MASARLVNISRRFSKNFYALKDVTFEIKDREVITILEPSGCGKSTLLRIVAGLDQPSSGEVWIGGKLVNDMPARSRDVAMVFQSEELSQIPPSLLPSSLTLQNYAELFARRPFGTYYLISVVISTLAALLCVVAASLTAHRLSRAPRRFRSTVSSALLVMAFFPPLSWYSPFTSLFDRSAWSTSLGGSLFPMLR